MQHVSTLPTMGRSGFESYVAQCVDNGETCWMPIGESIRLEVAKEDEDDGGAKSKSGGDDDDHNGDGDDGDAAKGDFSAEAMVLLLEMKAANLEMKAEIVALKEAQQRSNGGAGASKPAIPALSLTSL